MTARGHDTESGPDAHGTAVTAQLHGRERIDDIEILRAIAIIFVLIEHAPVLLFPWMGFAGGGTALYTYFGFWNGVDLFFAISGFVITRSLIPRLAATASTVEYFNTAIAFWIRRAWRLLPSAWLWLMVILAATVVFNESGAFGSFKANFEGAIAAIANMANVRTAMIAGRFEAGASFPYWSLSLEEQFYLILPILIFLSGRRLPVVLAVAIAVQFFMPRSPGPGLSGYLIWFRSDALLLGVLIAIWSSHPTYKLFDPKFLTDRPWVGSALLLLLTVLLAAAGSPSLHIVPFQVGLIAMISAVLVLIASYDKNCFIPNGPLKRVLLWFGSRSYAMYLIHIPAYSFTREIWYRIQPEGTVFTDRFAVRFAYTAAILLLVLVELNYRFVEVPLRQRGAQISRDIANRFARSGDAASSNF